MKKVETMIAKSKRIKDEKVKKESAKILKTLKRAFTNVVSEPDGLIVIRHIMEQSNWDRNLIVGNPHSGDVNDRGTLFNTARRELYRSIRKFIPVRALKKIEFEKTIYRGDDEDE